MKALFLLCFAELVKSLKVNTISSWIKFLMDENAVTLKNAVLILLEIFLHPLQLREVWM